tara:strand:+ start:1497 stop:2348 length:852 start_codon:yes stop_codon:yes gene_type:complete
MFVSKYIKQDKDGNHVITHPDKREMILSGLLRIHFYRLINTTPENATDEQVLEFFELRSKETLEGKLLTKTIGSESAADMVSRELKIVNYQQVMANNDETELPFNESDFSSGELTTQVNQSSGKVFQNQPERNNKLLPPIPRYKANNTTVSNSSTLGNRITHEETPWEPKTAADPVQSIPSKFLREENNALYIQTPNGEEERVTEYMKVHFKRMLEKDIASATNEDIETWWNIQGSLEPGISMQEARSQNLLTDALKAAGKLQDQELLSLNETIKIWLEARRH